MAELRHYLGSKTSTQGKSEQLQRALLLQQQSQRIAQRARLDALRIGQIERELIPVTDMDVILTDLASALSSQLRAWPSRLLDRLKPHIKEGSHDELFALVTGEITNLLLELKTMRLGHPEIDPDADPDFDEDDPDDTA